MFRRVSSLFHGRPAGGSLLAAVCLLALVALFGVPSSAAAAAVGQIATVYWKSGSTSGYEIQATVTTADLAESVTITGTGIDATSLYPTADGGGMVFQGTATFTPSATYPVPPASTDYTISVNYGSGTAIETLTRRITGVLGSTNLPGLTTPLGAVASSDSPDLHWTAPATPPAAYSVRISGPELFEWTREGVASNQTSVLYDGSALAVGTPYNWAVAAVDSNGNKAESRGSFVLGANFSGRVTNIDGAPLANIEVQAATLAGDDMGVVRTGADGTYIYAGLAPGDYKIHFDFRAYYWRNKLDSASADVLKVTAGAVTSNVNATIGGWGAISGSVYIPNYIPAAGAQVALLDQAKAPVASVAAVTVPLSKSGFGNFYVALIRPGTYYLRFSAPGFLPVDKQVVVTLNETLQGVPEVTATLTATVPVTLTVQNIGLNAGSGTVTSAPAGIACSTGSAAGCSSSYSLGTSVALTATSTAGSVFDGWSGACTGTGSCVVSINAAKNVTATFSLKRATVKIVGNSTPYFSIGKALEYLAVNNVTASQTITAKSLEPFVENVIMEAPGEVFFKGGYTDAATVDTFSTRTATSRTAIDGFLKIRKGKLIVERLVIK